MNKVIIMGNLGQDPDTRYMPSGQAVTTLSVATNRSWKDKDSGEKKDEVSWHRCIAFGQQAETITQYFKKGRKILIEGRLKYGSYEDKEGVKRYTTDIVVERFHFVEAAGSNRPPHPADQASSTAQSAEHQGQPHPGAESAGQGRTAEPELDDDIPF